MKNTEPLTFKKLAAVNYARCRRWHKSEDLSDWSISDWACAMAGEAGEICNAVKKLRRLEDNLLSKNAKGREIKSYEHAKKKIGEEIADTVLYLNLLAIRLGLNLEEEVVKKFNSVSRKYKFPEKL